MPHDSSRLVLDIFLRREVISNDKHDSFPIFGIKRIDSHRVGNGNINPGPGARLSGFRQPGVRGGL